MLLSSNVIHIRVRVVMLVRMIHTRLPAVAGQNLAPICIVAVRWSPYQRWRPARSSGCARTVGRLHDQELIKGNYGPLTRENKPRLSIKGRRP